jgi:hypothetical protein
VDAQVLGSGFEVISVGRRKLVRSVPTELNKDHSGILGLAQVCACNICCQYIIEAMPIIMLANKRPFIAAVYISKQE